MFRVPVTNLWFAKRSRYSPKAISKIQDALKEKSIDQFWREDKDKKAANRKTK
jgi:hypothetical protein